VRQHNSRIFKMTKWVYLSQRISGVISVDFNSNSNSFKSKLFRIWMKFWNLLTLFVLTSFIINSILILMIGSPEKKLPYVINIVQFTGCLYRSICLRLQCKKIQRMMKIMQNSLNQFPSALLREHRYVKVCILCWIYIIIIGM
jgi:hypothetical protein